MFIYNIEYSNIYINVGTQCRQVVTGGYVQVRSPSRLSAARTSISIAYIIYIFIINSECVLVRSGPAELQQYQDESDAPGKHLRNDIKYYNNYVTIIIILYLYIVSTV